MNGLIAYFTRRSALVNVISIAIFIAGVMVLTRIQREAFPGIKFDFVMINTPFLGATASDVEKHISIPLENELKEVDGIEEVQSISRESLSVVFVKLDPDEENKTRVVNDIKTAVDRTPNLPEDSETPMVTELAMDMVPVLELAVQSNQSQNLTDEQQRELQAVVRILEDRLRNLDGVARVEKSGYRDREMLVEVLPARLQQYQVGINEILVALSRKNINYPGGVLYQTDGELLIRTVGEFSTAEEVSNVLIRANDLGNWVKIGDVARVKDTFAEETILTRANGQHAITVTILKKRSADIIDLVDRARAELADFQKFLPEGYEVSTLYDFSFYVKRRLNVLVNNAVVGFFLVILALLLSLGWRISFMTAIGLPIAIFSTIVWMDFAGLSINLMTMFGLIMVLGMLVDDAIIVAENIYRHIERGEPLDQAVQKGVSEVIVPVAGTVLTTIAAFAPLMFMGGIMGKFVWTMPAVVAMALVFSWVESMFILPAHIREIENRLGPVRHHDHKDSGGRLSRAWYLMRHHGHPERPRQGPGLLKKVRHVYGQALLLVLKRRYRALGVIVLFAAGTIAFSLKFSDFILFPKNAIENLIIKAEARPGTDLETMSMKMGLLEKAVDSLPKTELSNYTTRVGIIQENNADTDTREGSNFGVIRVNLTPFYERDRDGLQILDALREKFQPIQDQFQNIEAVSESRGAPVGKAIQVTISGDDYDILNKIAAEYKETLNSMDGVTDVKDDYEGGKRELRIQLRPGEAAIAGLTVYDVATTVRSFFRGAVATTIKNTNEEVEVRVRYPRAWLNNLDILKKTRIANRKGQLIPLNSVVKLSYGTGISSLRRKNWDRTILVTGEISEDAQERGVTSVTVNQQLKEKFAKLRDRYPGYSVSYEGEFKDTEESIVNLAQSFVIAILIIYVILVALFRSTGYPLLILAVIPFTFLGVIWVFYFHDLPLSFFSVMGVVGLTGVVVNDSIILMDFIRKSRQGGHSPLRAALMAGQTRLRPVYLTTVTTFLGLIPTAYGWGGFDPFLKPMAVSMSWGLVFGTFLTLFATPVFYMVLSDITRRLPGRHL